MKHSIEAQCTALQFLCNTTLINMALQIIAGAFQLAGATAVAVSYMHMKLWVYIFFRVNP